MDIVPKNLEGTMDFKPIPDYENYIIYEDGTVVNTKLKHTIATQKNTRGYLTVNLWKHNKLKKFMVHRLVAMLFIPNTDNLPCINHKDKNKLNNHVSNLEWCDYSYNSNYSLKETREARDAKGWKTPVKQLVDDKWIQFESINDAHRKTGISINTIRTSLKKIYAKPRYIFEYVD